MPTMQLIADDLGRGRGVGTVDSAFYFSLYRGDLDLMSKKRFVIDDDGDLLEGRGVGLREKDGVLVGGKINQITVTAGFVAGPELVGEITDLGNAKPLSKVIERAIDRADFSIVQDYVYDLDWTILGTDGDDRMDDATFLGTSDYTGDNVVRMGAGNDFIEPGSGKDKVFGGAGEDFIDGGDGRDKLFGGSGADEIDGGNGNDKLSGGSSDDRLDGEDGNDKLIGGAGRDFLVGGEGNDKLRGGGDVDTFYFAPLLERDLGRDTILDYNPAEDSIMTFNLTRLGARQTGEDVLLRHSEGTILVKDADVADFASWDV